MLTKLIMKNFQSHKFTKLKFVKGVNVIIGETDAGKSAVIRCLKYITRNKPDGMEFIKEGEDTCRIILKTEEHSVTRERSKSKNIYKLNELPDFTAFGRGSVPEEIQKALNIEELNFQEQMDSPFLLKDPSGQVASHFNTIAHLDKIDTALSNVNSKMRQLNSDRKYCTQQIQQKREQLEELPDMTAFEEDVVELETLEYKYKSTHESFFKLIDTSDALGDLLTKQEIYKNVVKPEKEIDIILDLIGEQHILIENIDLIDYDMKAIIHARKEIKEQENNIKALKPIEEILLLQEKHRKSTLSLTQIQNLITSIEETENRVEKGEEYVRNAKQEYHKLFPSICPLCNQKIK